MATVWPTRSSASSARRIRRRPRDAYHAGVIPPPRRLQAQARLVLGVVVFVLVAAPLVFGPEGDVSNPDVLFVETTESTPATAGCRGDARSHPADDRFEWPIYGFTKARTHHLPLDVTPRPPYRQAWAHRGKVLLEFAPVLCRRKVYLMKNNAALYALSRRTGKPRWKRKLGHLAAASPACSHGVVYAVVLERTKRSKGGRVVAVSSRNGRTLWSRKLPSRAESSPLLDRGRLYFGTENGTVYSLRAHTARSAGRTRHPAPSRARSRSTPASSTSATTAAGCTRSAAPTAGRSGRVRRPAGRARAARGQLLLVGGRELWPRLHRQHERRVYSFSTATASSRGASDRRLRLRVARRRQGGGGPPTVYVGSYDGRFYALHARTGKPRWVRSLGQKISGAADDRRRPRVRRRSRQTHDLGARARDRRDGLEDPPRRLQPGHHDGRRIYFAGFSSLFALDHADRPFEREKPPSSTQRASTPSQRSAARSARRRAAAARRARAARNASAARRARALKRRVAAREARRERQLKLRFGRHGHRHAPRRGKPPPRCHRHRHAYEVRGRMIVLVHSHCHKHVPRR